MIKPIFLVGVPNIMGGEELKTAQLELAKKLEGYYVLIYATNSKDLDFKCFYEKDITDITFEELKEIAKGSLAV